MKEDKLNTLIKLVRDACLEPNGLKRLNRVEDAIRQRIVNVECQYCVDDQYRGPEDYLKENLTHHMAHFIKDGDLIDYQDITDKSDKNIGIKKRVNGVIFVLK